MQMREPFPLRLFPALKVIFLSTIFLYQTAHPAMATKSKIVTPTESMPVTNVSGDSYITWSVFLSCDPSWGPRDQERLLDLKRKFIAFGSSLGAKHVAIWFNPPDSEITDDPSKEVIDTDRTAAYCSAFKLSLTKSPYVMTFREIPKERHNLSGLTPDVEPVSQYILLELNALDASGIQSILRVLADQILVKGLNQEELQTERSWRIYAQGLQSILSSISGYFTKV